MKKIYELASQLQSKRDALDDQSAHDDHGDHDSGTHILKIILKELHKTYEMIRLPSSGSLLRFLSHDFLHSEGYKPSKRFQYT